MPILLFPSILINCFSSLLIPELARYHAKKNYNKITKISKIIIILTILFSIFSILIIYISSDYICTLLYKTNSIAKYIRLFSPLIFFIYLDIVIDSILKGINKQIQVMLINILDCLFSISFIYFFVPIYGLYGYILSIFISEIINFSLSLFILIKTIQKNI